MHVGKAVFCMMVLQQAAGCACHSGLTPTHLRGRDEGERVDVLQVGPQVWARHIGGVVQAWEKVSQAGRQQCGGSQGSATAQVPQAELPLGKLAQGAFSAMEL
jgi:hypothetical protein